MNKRVLCSLLLLFGALATPMLALAAAPGEDVSYTYLEGGYQHIDGSGALDADGAYVRGSYEFGDSGVYVLGSYAHLDNDGFNIRPRPAEAGVGYHYDFSDRVAVLGEIAYQRIDTRIGDAEGFRYSVGVRGQFNDAWEGLAKVNHYDQGDFVGNTTGTLGVQYRFGPTWGVTGEVEFDGDDQAYLVGLRASF